MHTTPDRIKSLPSGTIFVFGSNAGGQHGGGAARTAWEKFGAQTGVGEGLRGQSYALPTMEGLESFRAAAERFIAFAHDHRDLEFMLTKVGCGIAGYDEHDVIGLFTHTPDNVIKPAGW